MTVDIPTARGDDVSSERLGLTLMTETVFGPVDSEMHKGWPHVGFGDEQAQDHHVDRAVGYLDTANEHGVNTILSREIPGYGIGRDVALLQRVAQASPVNIILCTGYYTSSDLPYFFKFRERWPAAGWPESDVTLEDLFVRDLEQGIGNSGIRAGVIKCVTEREVTPDVETVLRATARAHRRTGAPITTHTGVDFGVRSGALQHRIFEQEGVDLSRVMLGHVDFTPPDVPLSEFEELLDKGSCLGFDTLSLFPVLRVAGSQLDESEVREARIARVTELCKRGYADRLLLSHDSCPFTDLMPAGFVDADAFAPYTEVILGLIPKLQERGVDDDQIDQMMRRNPRRLLESRALGPY